MKRRKDAGDRYTRRLKGCARSSTLWTFTSQNSPPRNMSVFHRESNSPVAPKNIRTTCCTVKTIKHSSVISMVIQHDACLKYIMAYILTKKKSRHGTWSYRIHFNNTSYCLLLTYVYIVLLWPFHWRQTGGAQRLLRCLSSTSVPRVFMTHSQLCTVEEWGRERRRQKTSEQVNWTCQ